MARVAVVTRGISRRMKAVVVALVGFGQGWVREMDIRGGLGFRLRGKFFRAPLDFDRFLVFASLLP